METSNYQLIGKGLYTLLEASRITHVPPRSIVRWTRGYNYRYKGERYFSEPLVARELDPINGKPILSFLDLIEIRFLNAFRSYGVSWKAIRISARVATEILKTSHPFSTKRFRTEGRTIFAEFVDETGDPVLIDLVKKQYEFRKIVSPFLYAGIEFNEDQEPTRWWPLGRKGGVVIDPMRSFGAPIVSKVGIPTQVLLSSFKRTQSPQDVADWFDIDVRLVENAIRYEQNLLN
jgi:uncharacterized protein (DUF433 family)